MSVIIKRIGKNAMMLSSVVNAYFLADQNQNLLSHLIGDSEHLKRWDGSYAASGANTLRFSLYMHVLSEMRAIMFDTQPKVASVHNVMKALEDTNFKSQLKKWFSDSKDLQVYSVNGSVSDESVEYFRVEEATRKMRAFDELIEVAIGKYQTLTSSELGIRVNNARNKMISHKQFQSTETTGRRVFDAADFGLVYSDAADIVEQSHDIIFSLYSLFTKAHFDSQSALKHHEFVANEFWSK
ncbi:MULTISPECIES: hypothetical protein [unclassified Oceanobacter]|uniref:AbiU2 domain-containing protein n=1 Tax=unclassified Oceanobacter TaxID=2620260 RepID=UPI002736C69D|nr:MULTISPECIES: hypothetical protein [unclassified Oceanobacter]MDP2609120.1 hypothetical protein [Oceanobacter sp. 1_MG-2023]MDP2612442.1 hypothetical protein [Oceanobacter sp. 2_MG-2023]